MPDRHPTIATPRGDRLRRCEWPARPADDLPGLGVFEVPSSAGLLPRAELAAGEDGGLVLGEFGTIAAAVEVGAFLAARPLVLAAAVGNAAADAAQAEADARALFELAGQDGPGGLAAAAELVRRTPCLDLRELGAGDLAARAEEAADPGPSPFERGELA